MSSMWLEYLSVFKLIHLTCAFIWVSLLVVSFFISNSIISIILLASIVGNLTFGFLNAYIFGWGILQNWFYNKLLGIIILILITLYTILKNYGVVGYRKYEVEIFIMIIYLIVFIVLYSVILK